jgi:hypothetical protein
MLVLVENAAEAVAAAYVQAGDPLRIGDRRSAWAAGTADGRWRCPDLDSSVV